MVDNLFDKNIYSLNILFSKTNNTQQIFCMAMKLFSSIKFRLFLKVKSKLKRPGCKNLVDDFADHLTYTNPAIFLFPNIEVRSRI